MRRNYKYWAINLDYCKITVYTFLQIDSAGQRHLAARSGRTDSHRGKGGLCMGCGMRRKLDGQGRLVIPVELRNKLQIENGDYLDIHMQNNRIVLQKRQSAVSFAATWAKSIGRNRRA